MKSERAMRRGLRMAALVTCAVVLVATAGLSASVSAAEPAERSGSSCLDASNPDRAAGRSLRGDDHQHLSQGEVREIDERLDRALAGSSSDRAQSRAAAAVSVPVHVHVIDGTRYRGPSQAAVRVQLKILNDAFDGVQSASSTPTGYSFPLSTFHRVRNQRWLKARPFDAASAQMRRSLHRGGPAMLNIYFTKPSSDPGSGSILGWSSFPSDARGNLKQDGVTINVASMPGGGVSGYNRGDTLVHEVGHWLGLFHTFQGACSADNDLVQDTAREREPSYRCDVGRDSCTAPGTDPVHNFMDYSFDTCMNMFTTGQVARMDDNWVAFRAPR